MNTLGITSNFSRTWLLLTGSQNLIAVTEVDTMEARVLVQEIIEAHGGVALWNSLAVLEAEISAWGFLFTAKRRPALKRVVVSARTRDPRLAFHDFPGPGMTGELIGDQEVRIVGSDGKPTAARLNPRSAFTGLRRMFSWDTLDFIYFSGYALWNYLVTPFLFLRDGFQFQVLEPREGARPPWLRLQVTFPTDIPTHCRKQVFYFDETRHLRRLDYTAQVVGRWARAAHLCENYRDFAGLKAPTRRRVRPILLGSSPLPGPTLVAIEVHDIRPGHARMLERPDNTAPTFGRPTWALRIELQLNAFSHQHSAPCPLSSPARLSP